MRKTCKPFGGIASVSSIVLDEVTSPFVIDGSAVTPVDSAVSVDVADVVADVHKTYNHNDFSRVCEIIDIAGCLL